MLKVLLTFLLTLQLNASSLLLSDVEYARVLIVKHEGFVATPYEDTHGLSIGYGTNLSNGISKEEAILLLEYRLAKAQQQLMRYSWFRSLDYKRKTIMLDMAYNLGVPGLLKFRNMIYCLKRGWYKSASKHMNKSKWYHQTGTRAKELVKLMKEE